MSTKSGEVGVKGESGGSQGLVLHGRIPTIVFLLLQNYIARKQSQVIEDSAGGNGLVSSLRGGQSHLQPYNFSLSRH